MQFGWHGESIISNGHHLRAQHFLSATSIRDTRNAPKFAVSDKLQEVFDALGVDFPKVMLSIVKVPDNCNPGGIAISEMERKFVRDIKDLDKRFEEHQSTIKGLEDELRRLGGDPKSDLFYPTGQL